MGKRLGDRTILSAPHTSADQICQLIQTSLDDDKAEEIVVINISEKCSFADFMVVANGRSQRHVGALASKLQEKLKQAGVPALSVEGTETCEWVLIDAGNVIVHLFRPETRDYYNLEKMWAIPMPALTESLGREVIA